MIAPLRFSMYQAIVARFMTRGFREHPVTPLAQPVDTTIEHVAHDDLFPELPLPRVRVAASFLPSDDAERRRKLIRTRTTLRALLVRLPPRRTPPVPTDEHEFLRMLYHPAYRRVWPRAPALPPELHGDPDVIAQLAVRGPFASYLRKARADDVAAGDAADDDYVIDLTDHLEHDVHEGLLRPGGKAVLSVRSGELRTTAVHRGDLLEPELAQRALLAALNEDMTTFRHNLCLHNVILTDMAIATMNHLDSRHPIRRVLQQTFHTLLIGNRENSSGQLSGPLGFAVTLFSHPAEEVSAIAQRRLDALDFFDFEPEEQFARRGTTETPFAYPYRDNVLELWAATRDYVTAYVDLYYPTDEAVADDPAIHAWADELDTLLPGGITRPEGFSRDWLVRVCATVIHLSSVEHDYLNNVVWDYGTFGWVVPTVVPASGEHMDQLRAFDLITTLFLTWRPFNMLLSSDIESMALDDAGRAVMLAWLDRLRAIQAEMESRGDDPSLSYPANLNISITN
jgi:hypothetical protein